MLLLNNNQAVWQKNNTFNPLLIGIFVDFKTVDQKCPICYTSSIVNKKEQA